MRYRPQPSMRGIVDACNTAIDIVRELAKECPITYDGCYWCGDELYGHEDTERHKDSCLFRLAKEGVDNPEYKNALGEPE